MLSFFFFFIKMLPSDKEQVHYFSFFFLQLFLNNTVEYTKTQDCFIKPFFFCPCNELIGSSSWQRLFFFFVFFLSFKFTLIYLAVLGQFPDATIDSEQHNTSLITKDFFSFCSPLPFLIFYSTFLISINSKKSFIFYWKNL